MLPPPDGYRPKSNRERLPEPVPEHVPVPMPFSAKPPVPVVGALSEHEALIIVKTTLRPEFQSDPRVLAFINSYVGCRDRRQAAREAGFSPHEGASMMQRRDVVDCISKITQTQALKYGIDAAEIVERVKELGDSDIADFFDPATGTWYANILHVPARARRAVKGFKVKNIYETDANGMRVRDAAGNFVVKAEIIEVDLYDKQRSNEVLGREFDLFKEKKVVENEIGKNARDVLLGAAHRADERLAEYRDVTTSALQPPPSLAAQAAHELMRPPSEEKSE